MFRFAHAEYLYLLLVIPVLIGVFIYTKIQRRRNISKFGNPELLADLMPNVSFIRPQVKFYLQLISVLLLIIVLAQPQFGSRQEKEKRFGWTRITKWVSVPFKTGGENRQRDATQAHVGVCDYAPLRLSTRQ